MIDGNLYNNIPSLKNLVAKCQVKFGSVLVHLYQEPGEPTYQYLDQVILDFKEGKNPLVDCLVGIGGGSAIDLAKGIATLATNHGKAIEYRGFPTGLNPSIPVIAVPSTTGTGTELAYNAVFIDTDSMTKLGINTTNNYPVLSLLDPEIVSSAPRSVVIASGTGALGRSLETFVTPLGNEISRIFSKEAFRFIMSALPKVLSNPKDMEEWSRMQWGAFFSMAALSNSSSGPAGPICYYLATNCDVPQGLGLGMSAVRFAGLNHERGYYGYEELFELLDATSEKPGSKLEKSGYVVERVEQLFNEIKVPQDLSSFNINPLHYKSLYEFCTVTAKGAFANNPIQLDNEEIGKILRDLLGD